MTPLIPFLLAAVIAGRRMPGNRYADRSRARHRVPDSRRSRSCRPIFFSATCRPRGRQRIFRGDELERIAKNRGLDLHGLDDVCFVAADCSCPMRRRFAPRWKRLSASPDVKIEILSSNRHPVPAGEVVFPRSGVQRFSGLEVTWHGYVQRRRRRPISYLGAGPDQRDR